MFQTKVAEKIQIHILSLINFFEDRAAYVIIWTNIVESDKPRMGTRIVQADSGSDTDSENRRQSAQSVVQADSGSDSDSESWRQSAHRMSFVGGAIQTV
jgi:hypothetical protein